MEDKEYTNGEITVIWKQEFCQHAAECVKGLRQVFNPKERPWIKMENASSAQIEEVVNRCPSGAISIKK